MKLNDQVCSRELAKKLKELGVEQESLFYWIGPCQTHGMIEWVVRDKEKADSWNQDVVYSAFTVAELGEMLPKQTSLTRRDKNGAWLYPERNGDRMLEFTEADARAKMLCYLIENKLI